MSQASSPAAKAAQMAVKTIEVDEVYRRQVEAVVDEYVANLSLGGGSSRISAGCASEARSSTRRFAPRSSLHRARLLFAIDAPALGVTAAT